MASWNFVERFPSSPATHIVGLQVQCTRNNRPYPKTMGIGIGSSISGTLEVQVLATTRRPKEKEAASFC